MNLLFVEGFGSTESAVAKGAVGNDKVRTAFYIGDVLWIFEVEATEPDLVNPLNSYGIVSYRRAGKQDPLEFRYIRYDEDGILGFFNSRLKAYGIGFHKMILFNQTDNPGYCIYVNGEDEKDGFIPGDLYTNYNLGRWIPGFSDRMRELDKLFYV